MEIWALMNRAAEPVLIQNQVSKQTKPNSDIKMLIPVKVGETCLKYVYMFLAKTFARRNAVRMQLTWKSLACILHSPCSVLLRAIKPSWSIKHIGLHISMSVFGGFECKEPSLFMSYGNSTLSWTWWTLNTAVVRCLWIARPTETEWVLEFKCWMFRSEHEEAVFHQKKWREVLFHQCCRYWRGRITMSRLVTQRSLFPPFSE